MREIVADVQIEKEEVVMEPKRKEEMRKEIVKTI